MPFYIMEQVKLDIVSNHEIERRNITWGDIMYIVFFGVLFLAIEFAISFYDWLQEKATE